MKVDLAQRAPEPATHAILGFVVVLEVRGERYQAQTVGDDLVKEWTGVFDENDIFDGHSGDFCEDDPAESIHELGGHAFHHKFYILGAFAHALFNNADFQDAITSTNS